jgi:hypothetical protein
LSTTSMALSEFDVEEMADLGEGDRGDRDLGLENEDPECVHRENQKKWFGKRGTSCIGFVVITNSDTAGQKNAMFFFLFTDDGCQMAKKRHAEGRLFLSFHTDNPNGKLLPLDTIRMGRAGSRRLPQQKKANRHRHTAFHAHSSC